MTHPSPRPPIVLSGFAALWLTSMCMALGFGCLSIAAWIWSALAGIPFGEASSAASRRVEVTTLCQLVAMVGTLVVALRLGSDRGHAKRALGLLPLPPGRLALLFAAGLCLQLPLSELANQLHANVFGPQTLEEQQAMAELLLPESPGLRVLVWMCIGVAVPVMEELLFRGALLTGLVPTQRAAGAVLVSAALFGLCHVNPVPVVYAFVAGLLLGAVRLRAGSTWASIALHAGVNTLPVVLGPEILPVTGFNVPSEGAVHLPTAVWLGGLAAALLLATAALRRRPPDA